MAASKQDVKECKTCGFEVPKAAKFCPACGLVASDRLSECERCEIAFAEGRLSSHFYAFALGSYEQGPRVVMRSRPIRFARTPRIERDAVRFAQQALVERLTRAGWLLERRGGELRWYTDHFTRER